MSHAQHKLYMVYGLCMGNKVEKGVPSDRWVHFITITDLVLHHSQQSAHHHVVRLDNLTPAHCALKLAIATRSSAHPNSNWRRGPGQPQNPWIQQIDDGTPLSIQGS